MELTASRWFERAYCKESFSFLRVETTVSWMVLGALYINPSPLLMIIGGYSFFNEFNLGSRDPSLSNEFIFGPP
jgi:hypothetical protein